MHFNLLKKIKFLDQGFTLIEFIAVTGIISLIGIVTLIGYESVIQQTKKTAATNLIINVKRECETNDSLNLDRVFTATKLKGYSFENGDKNLCTGDPNFSLVTLVPTNKSKNPSFFYDFLRGEIFCSYENSGSTKFPECKKINFSETRKYKCGDIGNWSEAQKLLKKGHNYLDRDKDGVACESLSRETNRPEFGEIVIKNCYDGDTCTSTSGEKIRLACIDTPEIRGKKAKPVEAKEARDFLNSLVRGNKVSIKRIAEDKYGRTVGELSLEDENLQQKMVNLGYAKVYKKYSNQCKWSS